MSAKGAGADANQSSRTPDENNTGGCVNCSRPVTYDNFVQCDQCDSWWHMICAGVTQSVAERPWTCRSCMPVSVHTRSTNRSAFIALKLQKLEEQRAIQQRTLEAEKKALEMEAKLMQEKYTLLEEQLAEELENLSTRSRVSRRASEQRVTQWVEQQSAENGCPWDSISHRAEGRADVNPEVETQSLHIASGEQAAGGIPLPLERECVSNASNHRPAESRPLVKPVEVQQTATQSTNPPTQRQQMHHRDTSTELPVLSGNQQRYTGAIPKRQQRQSKDTSTDWNGLLGNQQRYTGAIPKTNLHQRVDGRMTTVVGKPIPSEPPVMPPGKPPLSFVPTKEVPTGQTSIQYQDLLEMLGAISPILKNTSSARFFGTEPVARGHPIPTVSRSTPLERSENLPAPPANTESTPSNRPPTFPVPRQPESGPSPSQLAARQIMPRDLPPFAGNPADWPIFISSFVNTTAACGYSSVENLTRLQRCLKGAAYDAVRSRLLLPESVPQVVNTLQLLFGRPKLLINVLLDKVRSTPAPKAERLETLIDFGMAVQCLCDHLEAAGQQSHLTNPCLLMELVEKLPAHVKMEWANFMQRYPEVNLKTFGDFMNGVVISASKVTQYTGGFGKSTNVEKWKSKSKGTINAHGSQPVPPKDDVQPCFVCKNRGHRIRDCDSFKALSVDNRWKTVQTNELCRSCLNAHGRRSCRNASICGINGCTFRHHPLLHSNRSNQPSRVAATPNVESAGNHTHRLTEQSLLFRIIPVTLYGPKGTVQTYAFLDDGSSLTLVEEELANDLGISGDFTPLCLTWTGNVSRMEAESRKLDLVVSSAVGKNQLKISDVRTVKKLALPEQTLRVGELMAKYPHLKGLPITGYEKAFPRLLIGVNNLRLTIPLKVKEGYINEPVATKTRLGWCVYGGSRHPITHSHNFHACECDRQLHELVKDYFTAEDVGTKPVTELMSDEDRRAQQILEQTTVRVGEKYETGLLWRYDDIEFPDSYGMALRRLECLERRMERNPSLKESLHRQIEEYQQKGYAHRASEEEIKAADLKRVWYLPLGAVVNPKKPEKVRLIWDAAATVNGISLNSLLLKGPDQLASLPAVLSRFRQYAVAVSADIKEMFHQLGIREADRFSLRFLFRTDPARPPIIYVMDVATFGATCSPASAQFVKNKNAERFIDEYPRAVEGIVSNHYVDDYLDSFGTEEEAAAISEQVRTIHQQGGFVLRNWQSNSILVKRCLGEFTESDNRHLFHEKSTEYGRVLGMVWLTDEDALSFCAQLNDDAQQIINSGSRPTKRQVLRCLMSVFDPLGLLSSLLVQGKMLLQDIWRAGIHWDQEVNEEHWDRWITWTALLQQISNIRIPRWYFPDATPQSYHRLQLHVFVDASETAYAAVVYFRIVDADGTSRCSLVTAKTKVAPLKHLSIPRLELQAAVLGIRLMCSVLASHTVTVTNRYLWSDSTTVLAWLRADPRKYKQYVACRIGEILEHSELNEGQWVPSKQNPADYATKWGSGPSLDVNGAWFRGPSFLYQSEEEWPKQRMTQPLVQEELRAINVHAETTLPTTVIDCDRFSKWERLLRATAYVHRYVGNLKRVIYGEEKVAGYLTQAELRLAEVTLIAMAQQQEYPVEMKVLSHNRWNAAGIKHVVLDKRSVLYRLTPFIDEDGILRVDGRIEAAKHVNNEMKFPAILPKQHRITALLVDLYHRKFQHANAETVVNEMRQRYHVFRLRVIVRRIESSCNLCRIRKAIPHIPRMAALPPARLASFTRPFTYVGLDFFGPLVVKVGRSNAKRWVALFTCLTVRAVHCEVVCSLSTDACMKSIRRFVCRRGAPAEIFSDNGTNFHGTERVLMRQIQQGLAATVTSTTTKWLFIPPSSPHMGGAWERMVRSVKQAMMGAYKSNRKLDDESLNTLVIEAEAIVNSRPLTYLPLDSEESEALSPNHFLLGSSNGVRQPVAEPTDSSEAMKSSWKMINHQLDGFWKRWNREMLPTLTRRTKWFGEAKVVNTGDLVLIVEDGKRNSWTRGRVMEVVPGKDGRIRQAVVRTARGLLRRPVAKLAILDVGKTGTGGQCYGGEDVAAGHTASD